MLRITEEKQNLGPILKKTFRRLSRDCKVIEDTKDN